MIALALRPVIAAVLVLGTTPTVFWLDQLRQKAGASHATVAARPSGPAPVGIEGADWQSQLRFDLPHWPRSVLQSGWSAPEPGTGVWSAGRRASLRLSPIAAGEAVDVVLLVRGFVTASRPVQRVRIRSGAHLLLSGEVTSEAATPLAFRVPAEAIDHSGTIELTVDLPDAGVPAALSPGSADQRELAIKLHSLAYGPARRP